MHVLELNEPSAERDRLARPESAHHVDGLVEPRAAFPDIDSAGIELAGEFTADARAEHEAAAREVVDRDDLLGDGGGGTQRHQVHAGAERQALGQGGGVAQADEGIEHGRRVGDVLAAPEGIEPEILGQRHGLANRVRRGETRGQAEADGVVERKRHRPGYPGISSNCGRSSVISCQGAFDATKM